MIFAGRRWLLGVPRQIIAVHVVVERESAILHLKANQKKKNLNCKKILILIFIQSGRLLEDLYSLNDQAFENLLCFLIVQL